MSEWTHFQKTQMQLMNSCKRSPIWLNLTLKFETFGSATYFSWYLVETIKDHPDHWIYSLNSSVGCTSMKFGWVVISWSKHLTSHKILAGCGSALTLSSRWIAGPRKILLLHFQSSPKDSNILTYIDGLPIFLPSLKENLLMMRLLSCHFVNIKMVCNMQVQLK